MAIKATLLHCINATGFITICNDLNIGVHVNPTEVNI